MGRHHHLRLPEHLYLHQQLTPPPTPPPPVSSLAFASSLLSVRSAVYPPASSVLFQDAYGARAVRTSAAFFTTLRANLTIELDSPAPSCCNTPDLRPITTRNTIHNIHPLPSPLAHMADTDVSYPTPSSSPFTPLINNDEDEAPPPLTTLPALAEDDKVEALHLIADSVAQQRQYASTAILYHPLTLAFIVAIFAFLYKYLYTGWNVDLALLGTSGTGALMALLAATRLYTRGYIDEAESVGTWAWLDRERGSTGTTVVVGEADDLLLSKFGDQAIGALVLRGVRQDSAGLRRGGSHSRTSSNKSSRRQNSNGKNSPLPVTGVIRGFTVKNRYRRKGVGTELLEEAVSLCLERGWQGPEFDAEHANSKRLIPGVFCGPFTRREREARRLLDAVKKEMGVESVDGRGGGKKRR